MMLLRNKIMEALIPPLIWLTTFLENLNRGLNAIKPGPIAKIDRKLGRVLYGDEYLPSADLEAMAKALYLMANAGVSASQMITQHQEIEPYQPQPEYEGFLSAPADWKPE